MKKNCNHCGKYKDEEEFNWRYRALGIRHKTCRECAHEHNKTYFEGDAKERHLANVKERKAVVRETSREYVYQYLKEHPCSECGESDPMVLEFHHVRGEKHKDLSVMVAAGFPISTIQAEIDKCVVLCANCHRRVTMKEKGWFRGRK